MKTLKVFTDSTHYKPEHRAQLHNILKAHWSDKSPEERQKAFGARIEAFQIVDDIAASDFCLLPMSWDYYWRLHRLRQAYQFIDQARQAGKQCVVWSTGDLELRVPAHDVLTFQLSITKSRRAPREFASPSFISDNVQTFRNGEPNYRKKSLTPVVGFCGYAAETPTNLILLVLKHFFHRFRFVSRLSPFRPPPLVPAAFLRARILKQFETSPRIKTNYIIRDVFWAGVKGPDKNPNTTARQEYINNLDSSDYLITVRGRGNWSYRFYEVLNWGRIPVFIDTDCVLPYDFAIDWKQYCVYVDKSEIPYIAEKVADFHASLSDSDFVELQAACRQLWLDRLSNDGFFRHFHEHFDVLQDEQAVPAAARQHVSGSA